ncbi:DUF6114 domain-containing protein [Spirillospora sp. NPDC050679]
MAGATAEAAEAVTALSRRWARRARRDAARWRHWRRTRPFWAGLFTIAGGLTITAVPAGGYTIMRLPGLAELAPLAFGGLIIVLGVTLWARPAAHARAGATAIVLALIAFLYANLGGYLLGTLLGFIGGSLGHAWIADRRRPPPNGSADVEEHPPATGVSHHRPSAAQHGTDAGERP